MNNNDKKEEAIRLIKKGIGVIPLQNPEEPIRFNGESDEDFGKRRKSELDRRKQPALAWTPYKTRLATIDEVNNWFSFNANYNLAIPCGDVSGGLIAFDVDGETAKKWIEDKFPTMSEGLRKALNNTMRNVTGSGGQHFVFYVEGGKTDISQITIWRNDEKHSEIKIQGNYHYIATAPSRSPHNNGKLYESNGKDPVIITKEQLDEFIQAIGLPELVNNNNKNNNNNKKLSDPATTTSETNSSSSNSNQVMAELEEGGSRSLTPEQMQQLLQEVIPCYTPGGRNEIMYCLPGAMRKEGLRLETAEKFATLLSEEAGDTSEELRRSLDKVDRTYSQPIDELNGKKGLYEYLSSAFGQEGRERFTRICQIINNPDVLRNALVEAVKEEKRRRWEDGTDAGGGGNGENGEAQQTTDEEEDNSPGAWLSKKKQVDPHLDVVATICEEVLHREKFKTYADTKEIVVYRDGIYIPDGENVVEQLIDLLANYDITQHKINEIFRNVRVKTLTDRSLFDAIPNIITVENGLLDIFTWELKPHRPGFLSTTKYPMKYETEAECPITEQFLADTIQDPFKIREFLKFWGYVLTKDCKYEKAVMFVGTGANGKGILIRLMEAQEGGFDKCSHVSLHHMGEDRFATAGLYGKTLNTFADLEGDKLKSTGNLKTIISGDSVEGQHKHTPRFKFKNRAKIVVSANSPPETDDKTYAFFRRWLIIAFDRTFVNTDDENDPNKKDPDILEKMTTPQEMAGILNLRLKYLRVLQKENGFEEESFEVIKHEYESRAEHVSKYLGQRCKVDFTDFSTDCRTDTQTLYADYLNWCKTPNNDDSSSSSGGGGGNRIADNIILAENTFGSKLAELGITKKDRKRKGQKRGYDYAHVKLDSKIDVTTTTTLDQSPEEIQRTITNHENSNKISQTCQVCNQQLPSLRELQLHTVFRHPEEQIPTGEGAEQ